MRAIVACLVIGLAWIAVYYITEGSIPGMSTLGSWNLVVGFVFIIGGVALVYSLALDTAAGELAVPDHDRDHDQRDDDHRGEHFGWHRSSGEHARRPR